MYRLLRALALPLLVSWLAFACSSGSNTATGQTTDGGGSGSGGGGDSGLGGLGGFGGQSCSAGTDCSAGTFCSAAGICVDVGKCGDSADCTAGQTCDATSHKCGLGGACGKIKFTRVAPNVMILLDRSGSMHKDAGGDARWNVAKTAIKTVTTANDSKIRFGLATYSSCLPGGCSAGSIVVPIAANNAAKVNGFLSDKLAQGSSNGQNKVPGGIQYLCNSGVSETSTGKSLDALAGEPSLRDPTRQNAVLLLTDGEESFLCAVNGKNGTVSAAELLAQSPSVKTFVVGLGVNAPSLDAVAQAGGTGKLVPANNQAQLTAALDAIATQISSCDLALGTVPPDPTQVYVYFNGDASGVPDDATNGFTYDAATNTVHFHGTACDDIQKKKINSIIIGFGCKGVIPS